MHKVGVVMDPIQHINVKKDTTFAMLLEMQRRDWVNYYIQPNHIWLHDGIVWAKMQRVVVRDDEQHWFDLEDEIEQPLNELDVVFMRKDPPFDMDYIYLTYLLEQAEAQGVMVVNKPESLRDANEKLFTTWFPQCCPKTLISSDIQLLNDFIANESTVVVKPLHGMGGASVFLVQDGDPNVNVILENITHNGRQLIMAQRYIPEIVDGDKRILLIDGVPVDYALARIPQGSDFRGNLAAGGIGQGRELTDRDRWICEQVGPALRDRGLMFVGLDVIGDYLTEINVTSPTCVRELDREFNLNICAELMDVVEQRLSN